MENWVLLGILLSTLGYIVLRYRQRRRRERARVTGVYSYSRRDTGVLDLLDEVPVQIVKPARVPARNADGKPTADRRPADSDDGFSESLALGAATGVPVGRNPAGALLGAALHGDNDSRRHSTSFDGGSSGYHRDSDDSSRGFGGGHSDGGGSSGSYSSSSDSGGSAGGGGSGD